MGFRRVAVGLLLYSFFPNPHHLPLPQVSYSSNSALATVVFHYRCLCLRDLSGGSSVARRGNAQERGKRRRASNRKGVLVSWNFENDIQSQTLTLAKEPKATLVVEEPIGSFKRFKKNKHSSKRKETSRESSQPEQSPGAFKRQKYYPSF